MKKLISLLMAGAIVATTFAGCGKTPSQSSNATSTTSGAGQVETIRWWGNYGGQKAFIENIVKQFNDTVGKKEGIVLEFKNYGEDYNNVINAAAISGQGPELYKINNMLAKHATNGWILPLNDVPGGDKVISQYPADQLNSTSFSVNGKVYGVPMHYMTYRLIYNKDLFKRSGIVDDKGEAKEPKTWEDVYNYSKIITEKGNGKVFGFAAPLKWDSYAMNGLTPQATSATGVWRGFDFKTGKYNFSAYEPIVDVFRKMYKENLFFPGAEGLNNDSVRAHFAEGNIGMITGASWDVGVFNTQFVPKDDWGVAQPLTLEGKTQYKEGVKSETLLVINKQAQKKIDKVMKVYEFISGENFLVPAYENACWIPSTELVAKATKKPSKKGFEAFAKRDNGLNMSEDPTGMLKIQGDNYNSVIVKIILGLTETKAGLADLDTRYNAALSKSGLKIDDFIMKDFPIELKK